MTPATTRTIMTAGTIVSGIPAVLGALGTVPAFAPWALPLAALSTLLIGWAHLDKPGTAAQRAALLREAEVANAAAVRHQAQAESATEALAKHLRGE